MGRYHWSRDCHYISNQISALSYEAVKETLNAGGAHYKACSVCGKGISSGMVYILPSGSFYHGKKDCSALSYYVRAVPLSQVAYLGECSYCKRMKGE